MKADRYDGAPAVSDRATTQPVVVRSKIGVPALRGHLLVRHGLIAELDGLLERRVALVCAPAGFGKTWLVADWLGFHAELAQLWVSLDERDNDPARMWLHIVEAIKAESPEFAAATDLTGSGTVDWDRVVDEVLAALAEHLDGSVLVFDDIHLIDDPTALASLDRLIAQAPGATQVVLVGRHDPALRLGRLRVADGLVELRAGDLRLAVEEASRWVGAELLEPVGTKAIHDILDWTGGWIAGFRAALVSGVFHDAIAPLSAVRSDIFDLLMEEVLGGVEPSVRAFLLDTSILRYLNPDLCEAVSGRADANTILEGLVGQGLFTTPGDRDLREYRYHDLFREALAVELRRTDPTRIPGLHRSAARWFHAFGDPVSLVHHALAGGEAELAADWLVEGSHSLIRSGQGRTLIALGDEIGAVIGESPLHLLGTMAYAAHVENAVEAEEVDRIFQRTLEAAKARDAEANWEWAGFPFTFGSKEDFIAVIAGVPARRLGDPDAVLAIYEANPGVHETFGAAVAEALIWVGRYADAAVHAVAFADTAPDQADPVVTKVKGLGLVAMVAVGEGRLADAQQFTDRADELERGRAGGPSSQGAYAQIARGWVAWEQGDQQLAQEREILTLATATQLGELATYVLAQVILARSLRSLGDRAGAASALDSAVVLPSGRVVTGHFADRVAFERARMALLDGDVVGAEFAVPDWRERVVRGAANLREHLVLCRCVVAAGDDPLRMLEQIPDESELTLPNRIDLGIVQVHAALREADADRALAVLTETMRLGLASGHRQRFIDESRAFGALLENAAARAGLSLLVPRAASEGGGSARNQTAIEPLPLTVPLTARELDVLRLLPSHRTYQQIADELAIAHNTVKYHVKAIYRKLDVAGRAEAVDAARRGGSLR